MLATTRTSALLLLLLAVGAHGHGFCSDPRTRGAIKTQRACGSLAGEDVVGQRGWSYCPHCLNVRYSALRRPLPFPRALHLAGFSGR